jgi:hypothetical protein
MMTTDEIIEMARQVGMEQDGENFFSCNHDEIDVHITDLTAFAKLVAAKSASVEREACAKLIEDKFDFCGDELIVSDAIRARGVEA